MQKPGSSCAIALLLALFAGGLPVESGEDPTQARDQLVERIRSGPSSLRTVLRSYNAIERSDLFDVFGKYEIHQGLLGALRDVEDTEIATLSRSYVRDTSRSSFPSQVLLLKTVIGAKFPASRQERIDLLAETAQGKDERLAIWGVRLLGDSRWPEAVDRLIAILEEEEAKEPTGFLASIVSAEIYRLLGAIGRGTPPEIRRQWEASGKKLPKDPDYTLSAGGEVTFVFFGDRISPYSLFCIDTSSSMRQTTSLRAQDEGAKTEVKSGSEGRPRKPKVEIVREELLRALSGLQSNCRFNILSYNATPSPWRADRNEIQLHAAGSEAIESAKAWTRSLEVAVGTNIHDTLAAGLDVPSVETIYLLSDGVPSRGGGTKEVERRAAAMNYLRGVRIVTYGFTAEAKGAYDEEFMKRLAHDNWGWYRRLND